MAPGPQATLEQLFRRHHARLVSLLTRSFGPAHLELAQDVVQEAMVRALGVWSYRGMPDDPAGWLYRVARNLALDHVRRERTLQEKEPQILASIPLETNPELPQDLDDDQLRLLYLCGHPALPLDGRVTLMLKTVGGFGSGEIARAFLTKETTIAQRLVRAQRRVKELELRLELPAPEQLGERSEGVLEAIYLIFNEGYSNRLELCDEAQRLIEALAAHPRLGSPTVHALAALIAFQHSRTAARFADDGSIVLLEDQDRSRWDRRQIDSGMRHFAAASEGEVESGYHLQAAIASQHAVAGDDASTDWRSILTLYTRLYQLSPGAVIALNRCVAVGKVHGAEEGLLALDTIDAKKLDDYALLHATRAYFLEQLGRIGNAKVAYQNALRAPGTEAQRRFLMRRLNR